MSSSVQQKNYKEKIALQLEKLNKKTINTVSNKIKYFGILCTEKETIVGQKRTMSYNIIGTIHIRSLQNFDQYEKFNLFEIKINGNQILKP